MLPTLRGKKEVEGKQALPNWMMAKEVDPKDQSVAAYWQRTKNTMFGGLQHDIFDVSCTHFVRPTPMHSTAGSLAWMAVEHVWPATSAAILCAAMKLVDLSVCLIWCPAELLVQFASWQQCNDINP